MTDTNKYWRARSGQVRHVSCQVVTNLDRGEPDPSEFQIPADYKIETVVARGKQAERVPHQ
jgi:hypothetical protein